MIIDAAEDRTAPAWMEHRALLLVSTAVAYALGSLAAFALFRASTVGAVLFPPAGVTVAVLYLAPRRHWWAVLATVAVTEMAVDLAMGQSVRFVWGYALANTIEPLLSVQLLVWARPWARTRPGLNRWFGLVLVAAVVIGPAAGASIGALTTALGEHRRWLDTFPQFWSGDALAVLTIGSACIAWLTRERRGETVAASALIVAVVATAATTVVGFLPSQTPLVSLPLPVLAFVAVRYANQVVTTTATVVLAVTANLMTAAGRGPWAALADGPHYGLATLQLFLAVSATTAIALTLEITQRQRAETVASRESSGRRRMQALQAVTAQLTTASTSVRIAEIAVAEAIPLIADRGLLALADPAEPGTMLACSTAGGAHEPTRLRPEPGSPLARAAAGGEAIDLLASGPALPGLDGARRLLLVPITHGDSHYGLLILGFPSAGSLADDVVDYAGTVATLIGAALDRAGLYERSVHLAHHLQLGLLPTIDQADGLEVVTLYRPAQSGHEVGGDWYDLFALPGGRTGFVVGDVVGHDIDAAIAMGRLQNAVRILAPEADGPADLLARLDGIVSIIPEATFTTLVYGEYRPERAEVRYAAAGHPPPLLVGSREPELLMDGRSPPLGMTGVARCEATVAVEPGASLVLYTDGLVEDRHQSIEINLRRLVDAGRALGRTAPARWCEDLLADRVSSAPVADDVVILCLTFRP